MRGRTGPYSASGRRAAFNDSGLGGPASPGTADTSSSGKTSGSGTDLEDLVVGDGIGV